MMKNWLSLLVAVFAGYVWSGETLSLNGEAWSLSYRDQQEGGAWTRLEGAATVPGEAQMELFKRGILPNPEIGTNVLAYLPWERYEWKYERKFPKVDCEKYGKVELWFGGVDTRAEYLLNGEKLGESANAFIPVSFDVTGKLKDENDLVVHIRSSLGTPSIGTLGRSRIGGTDMEYLRRPQHSVGWDIMPRLMLSGLWKGVEVQSLEPVRFSEFNFITQSLNLKARKARCIVDYRVTAPWKYLHSGAQVVFRLMRNGRQVLEKRHDYHYEQLRERFDLQNVDFWWPRDSGEPALYELVTDFVDKNGKVLSTDKREVGIRTISLERSDWKSEQEPGTFCFFVNGERVYMHGCDTTPMDAVHSRDPQHVKKCVEMLVDLNCNMIRSWGGGVYEEDEFFELCDKNGILVWQDFSLSSVYPPQRDDYAAELEREAIYTVTRLRWHPSLALWCGNNEIDRSIGGSWGNKAPDPDLERTSRQIFPRVLREFDPFTPYLPSSPIWTDAMTKSAGYMKERLSQDHLWGPRAEYFKGPYWTNTVTTFVSETGVHGCPNVDSLKKMMPAELVEPWLDPKNPYRFNDAWNLKAVVSYPAQYNGGNWRNCLMTKQVKTYFGKVPETLDEFSRLSQIYQAEALKCWAGTYRCRKGRTWGMLWWNLRDGWPVISDAIVDYYYGKKRAYEALKLVNQPQFVHLCDGMASGVIAVNDRRYAVKGNVKVYDQASGKVYFDEMVEIAANGVKKLMEHPQLDGQGVLVIEYDFEGVKRDNPCVYGEPPFSPTLWLK